MSKYLIVGNWKMNGLVSDATQRVGQIIEGLKTVANDATVVVCPAFTLLSKVVELAQNSELKVGAQDCHFEEKGAFTSDISSAMLADLKVSYVILGHSERRIYYGESDAVIQKKVVSAISASLIPIICVGETKEQRDANLAKATVEAQLRAVLPKGFISSNIVIAYEPVWAIGTGVVASVEDIKEIHKFIRDILKDINAEQGQGVKILYGGSLNAKNANDILKIDNVNGGLIGGASLIAEDFITIISCTK